MLQEERSDEISFHGDCRPARPARTTSRPWCFGLVTCGDVPERVAPCWIVWSLAIPGDPGNIFACQAGQSIGTGRPGRTGRSYVLLLATGACWNVLWCAAGVLPCVPVLPGRVPFSLPMKGNCMAPPGDTLRYRIYILLHLLHLVTTVTSSYNCYICYIS